MGPGVDMGKKRQASTLEFDPLDVSFEPLAGSTAGNLLRLLVQNHFCVGPRGFPRLLYSCMFSFLLTPLHLCEKIWCKKAIQESVIKKDPIFIIGHWRSGTTYLHNLLTQDHQFGYPSTFQTITPGLFLRFERYIKPIVSSSLPPKRPQDDIAIGVDLPQEEEYAMMNLSPYSFYNGWCFPQKMGYYYKFVLMDDVSPQVIDEWKKIYLYFIKKVSLYNKGKQLVLKNPANTSRIKVLLDMFPQAQFIHIYRNPYHTFLSMKRNIEKELTLYCLQKPPEWQVIEHHMVSLYQEMYEKYFTEKKLIPKGNLIEVPYEKLIKSPREVVQDIYNGLTIHGFENVLDKLTKYISTQRNIKTHRYKIDEELKKSIYNYLKKNIDLWGYTAH